MGTPGADSYMCSPCGVPSHQLRGGRIRGGISRVICCRREACGLAGRETRPAAKYQQPGRCGD